MASIMSFTLEDTVVAKSIEHTLLRADATTAAIEQLCLEARTFGFFGVCVNPDALSLAKKCLTGSDVRLVTVVGFPLGAQRTVTKVAEAVDAIAQGADEIDMVLNIGRFLSGDHEGARRDIAAVVEACGKTPVKLILETAYLSAEQITAASLLGLHAGVAFLKTSTGFAQRGASVEDVALMAQAIAAQKSKAQIKASGGIRDRQSAEAMLKAGAHRLGTSASVAIIQGKSAASAY